MSEMEYKKLREDLEKQELDAPNGVPPTHIYEQLLALYLLDNDLTAAKFLWQRMPPKSKALSPELAKIWEVGKSLWQRNYTKTFENLSVSWSPDVQNIMDELKAKLTKRAISLVSKAYTSISIQDFSTLLNISLEESIEKVKSLEWSIDSENKMILPVKEAPSSNQVWSSDLQLKRLVEYVSFLET